jgi:hypothetical protein
MFGRNKTAREQLVRVEGNVTWQVAYDVAAKVYVGVCPQLNLNAIGDTWIEFQQIASESMAALFLDLVHAGEFETFVSKHGWHAQPLPQPGITPRFDIPFETRKVPELNAAYA